MAYLYLTRPGWADAWINGGSVPISPASKYLSQDRRGIMTPDEVRQRHVSFLSPGALETAEELGGGYIAFENCSIRYEDGTEEEVARGWVESEEQDALILCFSRLLSRSLMRRLNKRTVVRILDMNFLKSSVDDQLGTTGFLGDVEYTIGPDRSHFLKSMEDAWQAETRMMFRPSEIVETLIHIPPGLGEVVPWHMIPDEDPEAATIQTRILDGEWRHLAFHHPAWGGQSGYAFQPARAQSAKQLPRVDSAGQSPPPNRRARRAEAAKRRHRPR